ncbi:TPA: hypothetical protein HA265_02170 [Candidatus Woesearchaeota archaeon]|nr:hypothetical protein [Candidatus Woesearchaeota archaeon]
MAKKKTTKGSKPKRETKARSSPKSSSRTSPYAFPLSKPKPQTKKQKEPFTLKTHHYYAIYVFGFIILSLAVFIFLKNILSTVPINNSLNSQTTVVQADFKGVQEIMPKTNGEMTAQELQDLLSISPKIRALPKDYAVQIYFYDETGTPRSHLYFQYKDGKVIQGKSEDYELSISTSVANIPELKRSNNFCLVMETIWMRNQDIRIEYGISEAAAFIKYGSFARSCVPSAMESITGFSVLYTEPNRADRFFWYAVLLISMIMGIRFYLDAIEKGY